MIKEWKPFPIFAVLALIFLPAATAILVESAKNIVEASPGVVQKVNQLKIGMK